MALLLAYRDEARGIDYPDAIWLGDQLEIDARPWVRRIKVTFSAYLNAATYLAGKRPIADSERVYLVEGDEFLEIVGAAPEGETRHLVIGNAVEEYALNKLEILTGNSITVEINGELVQRDERISRFHGAIQVTAQP